MAVAIHQFSSENFHGICNGLAKSDDHLAQILTTYGYPPMWTRPNTFESLVHIILEQQVSLASALSALNKLRAYVQEITPARVLLLSDEEFRACYCSRQKTAYIKYLAEAILSGQINLQTFEELSDDDVGAQLTALKGIGKWTVDVYLMFVLQRADIFPVGDLAAVNALKQIKKLPAQTSREHVLAVTAVWQPYRTIATMILWHYYLSTRNNKA